MENYKFRVQKFGKELKVLWQDPDATHEGISDEDYAKDLTYWHLLDQSNEPLVEAAKTALGEAWPY